VSRVVTWLRRLSFSLKDIATLTLSSDLYDQPGTTVTRLTHIEERASSVQKRYALTRLHDPDQIIPAQQVRELLRVGDRLISVAVV
jgi:hypothetical protein